jgi:hypothetical protein
MFFHRICLGCLAVAMTVSGAARDPAAGVGEDRVGQSDVAVHRGDVKSDELPAVPRVPDHAAREAAINGDHAARLEYVLEYARAAQQRIDTSVHDYTCMLVKRERVEGRVGPYQFLLAKIRHEQKNGDQVVVPFSVFLRFLKPERMEGREVIFVQNGDQGDLIARRGGRRSPNVTVQLAPDSPMAMDGNRYPISEIGFQNLTRRVIEVLEQERQYNDGIIEIFPNATVDDRKCTHFRLTHHQPRPDLTYHMAEMSVDDELAIPVYFRSFDFPVNEGEKPRLLEEYSYRQVKMNVGLTETDFDIRNPEYHFQIRDSDDDGAEPDGGETGEEERSAAVGDGDGGSPEE